ncbi:hypothetical protein V518_1537 [Thermoanaerobacterium aotearoense SCUT27]|uniref:DUF3899 domain-containing protein n=2 Tax=Thermoanaerobacterium TaxID=28895 RepID=W9EFF0_9THEO|nr:hypothetical protein Tsac_1540 [Thermoanaerobacterium saccharolyticum JW/SL-YS485]ETO38439.1 hypothetical protein V518_1537 [Thermoanaerobacterium aotearoense SCUT27]
MYLGVVSLKGILLGIILSLIAVIANIALNGIHSTYVSYSNYFFIVGCIVGLIGGFLYVSYWFNDMRTISRIFRNLELPERRYDFIYMTQWGKVLLTAAALLMFLSLLIVLLCE